MKEAVYTMCAEPGAGAAESKGYRSRRVSDEGRANGEVVALHCKSVQW